MAAKSGTNSPQHAITPTGLMHLGIVYVVWSSTYLAIRIAVREVVPSLETARVAPLMAWLRAWRHHWSDRFERTFGAEGAEIITALAERLDDPNRYLKLRRIAIANLARIL